MTATFLPPRTTDRPLPSSLSAEQMAEAELLARLRAGDEEASALLVQKYFDRMLAVARRFLRREEDRADAVQDAFLSAFRSLEHFEGQSLLGTWLHRIVVNACLMKLRAQSRRRSRPMDDLLPSLEEAGFPRYGNDPGLLHLAREETRRQVRACIDQLPEPYRTVLLLRDIEELDTEQTAQRLGIAPGAVKTRLHRARHALRLLLEPLALDA